MQSPVTLKQLKLFESVARLGSYTRAAEEANLTQPAVSIQLKHLDETLAMPLFEKVGRKFFLTEAGELLLRHARIIIGGFETLEAEIDELKGIRRGRLRISVVTTVNTFAPDLLLTFQQRYPEINIILDVANHKVLLKHLLDNDVDLVIMGHPPEALDLDTSAFLENPLVIVAHPKHRLATRKNLDPSALVKDTFIMREPGSGTRSAMERFFAEKDLSFITSMEVSGAGALKQSVQAGLGLGLMSRDAVRMELDAGLVVELDVKGLPIQRHWYLVHHKGKRLSPPAQAFKEFVLGEASAMLREKRRQV